MKKEEILARDKKHWNFILVMMCVSMLMSGCAGTSSEKKKDQRPQTNPTEFAEETETEDDANIEREEENLTDTEEQESEDQNLQQETVDDDWTEDDDWTGDGDGGFREITDLEKEELTNFVRRWDAYGFLLSEYTIPEEVNLGEVFYSGAGASEDVSSDEIRAYLKACNQEELFTECRKITKQSVESVLDKRLGLTLEEANLSDIGVYLPEYDAYYGECGDTNYMAFTCVEGLANNNVYTVDFVADVDWDWEFSKVRTIMEKTEEGYRFISNTSMVSPE